jgi:hypothetical protein
MFAPPVTKAKPKSGAPSQATTVTQSPGRSARPLDETGDSMQRDPHADAVPDAAWDFSSVPTFAPGAGTPRDATPRFPIQAKREAGATDDPLEREADRVAREVMTGAIARQPRLRAAPTGEPLPEQGMVSPDGFRGRGDPLPAPVRGFFEQRFDHDFTGVRVHHGPDAASSARSLGASAYTYGRDIVFGAGDFSRASRTGLLAHELAHVVQQGAGQPRLQRSPLSDDVKAAFTADPKIETLLARLSQADVQAAQADADVDTEIASILASRPDDLFLAQRIRQGKLGDTAAKKPRPIKAFFFRGSTDRRALVIGGVHGTEKQGIDVAEILVKDLQSAGMTPVLTTIVVPSLFPDNAARGSRNSGKTPTNRNFPHPSKSLADARNKKGTAFDALGEVILPENVLLMELMERFKPERIISIHGTHHLGAAGVTYDRRILRPDEVAAARAWASGMAYMRLPPDQQEAPDGQERLRVLEEQAFRERLGQLSAQAEKADSDLSLKAATSIDAATAAAGIKGRESRELKREHDPKKGPGATEEAARKAHPSIAGNIGKTGKIDFAAWSGGGSDPGFSLGGYAPARGMSVFTVEPPVDAPLTAYPEKMTKDDPGAADRVSGKVDKLKRADRMTELKAYADAVRTVLLGT